MLWAHLNTNEDKCLHYSTRQEHFCRKHGEYTWNILLSHRIQADFWYGFAHNEPKTSQNQPEPRQAMDLNVFGFILLFAQIYLYDGSIDAGLQSHKSRAPVRHRFTAFPQVVAAGCRTTQGALKHKNLPKKPTTKEKKGGWFPSWCPCGHPEEGARLFTSGLGVNGSHGNRVGEAQLVGRGAGEYDAHKVGGFGSAGLLQLLLAQILLRDDVCRAEVVLTSI